MRVEKRRVVLNIPREIHSDLHSIWCEYKATGMAPSKERFPEWLIRWLRDWIRRDEIRLRRRWLKKDRERKEAVAAAARERRRKRPTSGSTTRAVLRGRPFV